MDPPFPYHPVNCLRETCFMPDACCRCIFRDFFDECPDRDEVSVTQGCRQLKIFLDSLGTRKREWRGHLFYHFLFESWRCIVKNHVSIVIGKRGSSLFSTSSIDEPDTLCGATATPLPRAMPCRRPRKHREADSPSTRGDLRSPSDFEQLGMSYVWTPRRRL